VLDSLSSDGTFFGVDGLQRMLAESPDVQGCFSRQWLRFAYGVAEEDVSCEARTLAERFQTGGLSIPELLLSLTQLPAFTARHGEVSTIAEPLPGSPAAEPLLVQVKPQSSWESGYCDNVEVTNAGPRELEWRVPLKLAGTLKDAWTAQATPLGGGEILFTGLSYNRKIAPGATVIFGYCASR
jgi:cellulase/cellobiase CelA1